MAINDSIAPTLYFQQASEFVKRMQKKCNMQQ